MGYIGYKHGMNTFSLQAILVLYWLMGCNIRCTKDVLKFPFGWFPKLGFPTWVGPIKGMDRLIEVFSLPANKSQWNISLYFIGKSATVHIASGKRCTYLQIDLKMNHPSLCS